MKRWSFWLCIAALAGCSKPASVQQPADDPSSRTTTFYNPPSTPQEMAEKCDVPMYVGSKAPEDMSRVHRNPDGSMRYELVLTTHDSPQKVSDYYAAQMKLPSVKSGDGFSLVGKSPHKNDILIEIVKEGGQTVIRIHSIAYKSS
jgi:hypothetical protein